MRELKHIKIRIALWLLVLAISVSVFSSLLIKYTDCREGFQLNDCLINYFTPIDLSIPIFILTYGSILFCLIIIFQKIRFFEYAVIGYLLITIFRILSLYYTPLAPPQGIIPLNDPILEASAYQGQKICIDLFFSGHVSTMVLFGLLLENKNFKSIVFINAFIVGLMLVMQHVHYSIDVIFAPLFSILSLYISKKICGYFY